MRYGLRRNETRMLDLTDFGRDSEGREIGEYGTLLVRYGRVKKGSPPKPPQRADHLALDTRHDRGMDQ